MEADSSEQMEARSSRRERHPLSRQAQRRRGWYARLGTQSRRARWECWRSDAAWAAMERGWTVVGGVIRRRGPLGGDARRAGWDGWTDALTRLTAAAEAALTRLASARLGFVCWRRCPPQRHEWHAGGRLHAMSSLYLFYLNTRVADAVGATIGGRVLFK